MSHDESRHGADPLDPGDPRFDPRGRSSGPRSARGTPRELVESQGPGASPRDPRVRVLRYAVPLIALAGVAAVAVIFVVGLNPGSGTESVGQTAQLRAAVAERPRRICLNGQQPCAWLTVVDGELLALKTAGPLPSEYGRQGVKWCPSSGYFGSNNSGSRFDPAGRHVTGPAPRGLDRYRLTESAEGRLTIDFFSLTAGQRAERTDEVLPRRGPACPEIPFDRDPDLELAEEGP